MNADRLLAAEATLAIVGVSAADLIGQGDQRTLPKPRRIMAAMLFYGALSFVADLGAGPARFAAAAGGVTALASLVLGTTGKTIVDLLDRGAGLSQNLATGAGTAGQQTGPVPPVPLGPLPGGGTFPSGTPTPRTRQGVV